MNEKDKKSLIIISSVFVFTLVFMVFFTFYRRDAMLSDRTVPRINTNTVVPEDDPPALGDIAGCKTVKYYCNDVEVTADTHCCDAGYTWSNASNMCIKKVGTDCPSTYPVGPVSGKCCPSGYVSSGGICVNSEGDRVDPVDATDRYDRKNELIVEEVCGTCKAGYYKEDTSCEKCPAGKYCPEGTTQSTIKTCPTPYTESDKGTTSNTDCYVTVSAGQQLKSTSASSPVNCPAGTSSSGGKVYYGETSSCETCGTGKYNPTAGGTCQSCDGSPNDDHTACIPGVCCIDNNGYHWYSNTSSCSVGTKTGDTTQSLCESHNPTPTTTCYKFANNTCTSEEVTGTTCNSSNNYYSTWESCRNNITCGTDQYLYGDYCTNCPAGKTIVSAKCQGTSETCCKTEETVTILLSCPDIIVGNNGSCIISSGVINGASSSANSGIAAVVGSGSNNVIVKGNSVGSTTISTTVNSKTVSATVNVVAAPSVPFTSITISGADEIEIGDAQTTRQYTASTLPANANDKIIWSVSPTTHATINQSGLLYALDAGVVTITARSTANPNLRATKTVTIKLGSDCKISLNNVSKYQHMSFDEIEEAQYVISGRCGNANKISENVNNFENTTSLLESTYTNQYKPTTDDCVVGKIKGCIKGTSVCSDEISIMLMPNWVGPYKDTNVSTSSPTPNSAEAANIAGEDKYYVSGSCVKNSNNTTYTCDYYYRGCGGAPTGSPDNPTPSSDPKYCFIKRGNGTDNQYCNGTTSYCNGKGFTEKVDSSNCGEDKACYLRTSDNTYVVGKFSGQSGYTYYGTTCPVKKCYIKRASSGNKYKEAYENPGSGWEEYSGTCSEDKACYLKESDNTYVTGTFNDRDGYTKVDDSYCQGNKCYINRTGDENDYIESSTNPGEGWEEYSGTCSEDEACYLRESDNTYVTGKYKDKSGYTYYGTSCPVSKCYVSESGEYVWGDYSSDSSYTLVPEITDKTNCGYTPDVPQTSMDVKTIVYIAVAIMSVVGLYFVVKYNNESKNI